MTSNSSDTDPTSDDARAEQQNDVDGFLEMVRMCETTTGKHVDLKGLDLYTSTPSCTTSPPSYTCNEVRRMIRDLTTTGVMSVAEFRAAINVSSPAYAAFMKRTAKWDGRGCDTYRKGARFFERRVDQGLPIKYSKAARAKLAQAKTGEPPARKAEADSKKLDDFFDVRGVECEDELADGTVPVYDTPDMVRKKLRLALNRDGVSQARLCRELSKGLPEGQSLSANTLRYFMGQKGVRDGNTSPAFYAGYIFFEKRRIKDHKPKTDFREDMEEVWDFQGFDREHGKNTCYVGSASTVLVVDQFGKIRSHHM